MRKNKSHYNNADFFHIVKCKQKNGNFSTKFMHCNKSIFTFKNVNVKMQNYVRKMIFREFIFTIIPNINI